MNETLLPFLDPGADPDSAEPVSGAGHHESLGVCTLYPKLARDLLVRAAEKAESLPLGSLARRRAVEDAIVAVKARWPDCFLH